MDWSDEYKKEVVSKQEMAKQIKSGDAIVAGSGLGCRPDRGLQLTRHCSGPRFSVFQLPLNIGDNK
jgi:hypothetical protein